MVIGVSTQVQQPQPLQSPDNRSKLADKTGIFLPPDNHEDKVDISDHGRLVLEREMQNIATARENQEFVDFQGHAGKIRLGLTALGKTAMGGWSDKGLELTQGSILAAAEAFQDAFRNNLEAHGSSTAGTAISLNRHQIVINSQSVPDWFFEEYKSALLSISDSNLKSAFENGVTFFVSPPATLNHEDNQKRFQY